MAGPFAKRKRLVGGPVSQLVVTGAYSGGERLGARPPWIFRILRERALSLTTAIEKETKRYIRLSPFLPFCLNNILINKYVSMTTLKSD